MEHIQWRGDDSRKNQRGRCAAKPSHPRDRFIHIRVSDVEFAEFERRTEQSGARSPSEYIRAACLTGAQLYLRDEREDMNNLIRLTGEIQRSPDGPIKDAALQAAMDALNRFMRR